MSMHASAVHAPKMKGPRGAVAVLIISLVFALIGVGLGASALVVATQRPTVSLNNTPVLTSGKSISDLYKDLSPTAVFVFTSSNLIDEYGEVIESAASGSGVIVDANGYIVTNAHVVTTEQGNGDITVNPDVQVALSDKRVYVARVLGLDLINDIAVLKIEERNLPVAEYGEMDKVDIGDQVIAIGSPAGTFVGDYRNTLTAGMVGGLNQTYGTFGGSSFIHNDLIQHSAAINPGNSGGPLFDADGKLIGINTLREIGDIQGIFFAVPVTTFGQIATDIIETGEIQTAYTGIAVQSFDLIDARRYQLGVDHGAYVVEVFPGSPGWDAGMYVDDIILQMNGQDVESASDFDQKLRALNGGDIITLTVDRFGVQYTVTVGTTKTPTPKGI